MAVPQDPDSLQGFAQQFISAYYSFLDGPAARRPQVASLYHKECQMLYEGNRFLGKEAVEAKFATFSNMAMMHDITTFDVQVVSGAAVLITALGQFRTDGEEHTLPFTQTFFLMPCDGGTFAIMNDIYRLALFNNA